MKAKQALFLCCLLILFSVPARAATTVADGEDIANYLNANTTDLEVSGNAIWNSEVSVNAARSGLSILGSGGTVTVGTNRLFSGFTVDNSTTINNLTFKPASSTQTNAALMLFETAVTSNLNLDGVVFDGFRGAGKYGNVIRVSGSSATSRPVVVIDGGSTGVVFQNGRNQDDGNGAVGIYYGDVTFTGTVSFINNWTGNYGGALATYEEANRLTFEGNTTFRGNHAVVFGGAIDVYGGQTDILFNGTTVFDGNYVMYSSVTNEDFPNHVNDQHARGGALNVGYLASAGTGSAVTFNGQTTFTNNRAISTGTASTTQDALGGAVSVYGNNGTRDYRVTFNGPTLFQGNYAYAVQGSGYGGAIYYNIPNAELNIGSGSQFLDNYAKTTGGAIYLQSGTINLNATTDDILFSGNRQGASFNADYTPISGSGDANAIYLASGGTLNFNAADGYSVIFYDPIASASSSTVTVVKSGDGDVLFQGDGTSGSNTSDILVTTNVNAGRFILSGAAEYGSTASGAFNVNAGGTLLGGGGSTLHSPALAVAGTGTLSVSDGLFTLDAASITMADGSYLTGNGQLDASTDIGISGTVTGDIADGSTLVVNRALSGTGGLTKTGDGSLTLAVAATYTGATAVNAGALLAGAADIVSASSALSIASGASFQMQNYDQTVNALSGAGSVIMGSGDLTVNSTAATQFSGVISGSGDLTKIGANTLTLSGANTYTGGTSVAAGTLVGTNGSSLGTGAVDVTAILELNFASDDTFANSLSGSGTLNKTGAGTASLTAAGSSMDTVNVSAGTLSFDQSGAFTAGTYTTATGGTTNIGAAATLETTTFTQTGNAALRVAYRDANAAVITATTTTLSGSLTVSGFAPTAGATASSLADERFLIISSTNAISGDFSSVTFDGYVSPYDFVIAQSGFAAGNTQYYVGLGLAWFATTAEASGTFTLGQGQTFDVDVVLSDQTNPSTWDGASLTKAGAGELILSQVNTYTGTTSVNGGTLTAGIADAFADSSAVSVASGATLNLNGYDQTAQNLSGAGSVTLGTADLTVESSSATTFSGVISGSGSLTKSGTGTFTLSGANTYSGGTTINDGTLIASTGSSLGSGAIVADATLQLDFSADTTLTNAISGTGTLNKTGTGTATLSGLTSMGTVTVTGGGLALNQALSVGTYSTASGATTSLGSAATISASTFAQANGSTLEVAYRQSAGAVISTTNASLGGDLIVNGFSPEVGATASSLAANRFVLLTSTNAMTGDFSSVTLGGGVTTPYDFIVFDAGFNTGRTEYSLGLGLAWFADTTEATGTFTLAAGETFTVDVDLTNQTNPSAWDGQSLTKAGDGTLILSGANTYTGTTTVTGGTLTAGAAGVINSSSRITVDSGATLNLNGYDQTAQNLSGAGNVTLGSAVLTVTSNTDTTFSGTISDNGSLVKNGSQALTLSGANTYSGGTTINAGTLIATTGSSLGTGAVSVASVLELDFAGNETVRNTLSGTGTLTKTGAGTATLSQGGSMGTVNVNEGTLALAQLTGFIASTYQTAGGATTSIGPYATLTATSFTQAIGSTLQVAYNDGGYPVITATSASLNGDLVVTGFGATGGNTASSVISNRFEIVSSTNAINGNFSSVSLGSGSASPYDFIVFDPGFNTSRTVYSLGFNLAWFVDTAEATGTFNLADGESFDVDVVLSDQTNPSTWDGTSLTKTGAGELILSAVNTYTGTTTVTGGTLTAGIDDAFADSSAVSVASGATLNLNGYDQTAQNLSGAGSVTLGTADLTVDASSATTFSGVISGSGSLIKSGSGTFTLSGANTYAGGTTISSGTLVATNGSALGTGQVSAGGATLELAFANSSTMSNRLSGGTLLKTGNGTATLTGANSSVGQVTNQAGGLTFASNRRFAATGYTAASGTTTSITGQSWLDVSGSYIQSAGSTLNAEVKANQAAIVATNASLAGTLNVSGFTSTNPMRASDLEGQRLTVVQSANAITGTFDAVNFGTTENEADYLILNGALNSTQTAYTVGMSLRWTAGSPGGNGTFTLGGADAQFEVDVVLADQTGPFSSNWDGQTLTKAGEGTLILSAANTYTGATDILEGTIRAGIADTIAASSQLSIASGATFDLDGYDQQVNNLQGSGNVDLGSAQLTASNTQSTTFSGTISGSGGVVKDGTASLTLSGDNDYSGGTVVRDGRLVAASDTALGSGDAVVDSNGILEIRAPLDRTLQNGLSGTGTLEKTGSGTLTIVEPGSMGDVRVVAGTLAFGQQALQRADGYAFEAGTYTTQSGATTQLNPGARLLVDNVFTQQSGSALAVSLTQDLASGAAAVTADSADITGSELFIAGFTTEAPMKASEVLGSRYLILDTTGGITGDFDIVAFGTRENQADYLQVNGALSADRLQYTVGLNLSWLSGTTAHGTFTLSGPDDYFEVDIPLTDQTPTSIWDGQTLTKRGQGTLLLSAVNTYTGLTLVEEGVLVVGGPAPSSRALLATDTASIAGDVRVEAAGTLTGYGVVHGTVTNAGTVAALNALDGYADLGASQFTIGGMSNSGTVQLAGSAVGNVLLVRGDWQSQGGSLVINTVLGGDDSATDKLIIDGGTATGTTSLVVQNQGGAGAITNVGIEVVAAINGATTETGAFVLSPDSSGYRSTTGTLVAGAYDYSLTRGGNGGEAESWYLTSVFGGGGGGEGPGIARPEAGIYLGNQEAATGMFTHRLHDRLAGYEIVRSRETGAYGPGAAWARVYGRETRTRADHDHLKTKTTTWGFQTGLDVFQAADESYGSFQAGVMFGIGRANIRSHNRRDDAYSAGGDTLGYAAGIYGTWFQDPSRSQGFWADAWVQHAWFDNEVRGRGLDDESYSSRQWSGSIELGYTLPVYAAPGAFWAVEPSAQAIFSSYTSGDFTESSGTRISQGTHDNVATRLGARFKGGIALNESIVLQPFLEAYWWNDSRTAAVSLDQDTIRSTRPKSSAEIRGGLGARLGDALAVSVDVMSRLGGSGYRELGGQVGFRFEF